MSQLPPAPEEHPGRGLFRWEIVAAFMGVLLLFLAFQLWRRLENVDPVQRCAGAYQNVHTAIDTSLVDGIAVNSPGGGTPTTCGELRSRGVLSRVPGRSGLGGLLPPQPKP